MDQNQRFSLLPFPQVFDGQTLTLNIVVLPRNHNPLMPAIEDAAGVADPGIAFADAQLHFTARVVSGLAGFPNNHSPAVVLDAPTVPPAAARELFEALAKNFDIGNSAAANRNDVVNAGGEGSAPAPLTGLPVRKYLPLSYRGAFNFTTPRTKAAVTDDSYRCAIRDASPVSGFKKTPERITWGKAFAYALRQPTLARHLGIIYHDVPVDLDGVDLSAGGWLFIDLADDSDFRAQMTAAPDSVGGEFIRSYAVRLPELTPGTPRQLFAPLLFPVLYKKHAGDSDPLPPPGNYAELFTETADYDDGFARIVHSIQPVSRDFLAEDSANGKPVKDAGIRLAWDDEQILIWYLRQLAEESSGSNQRIDAPLGVNGYAIDVRDADDAGAVWQSLNAVKSINNLQLPAPDGAKNLEAFDGELPYQVYPSQLDGKLNGTWWLPMYFANWTGGSIVLPDLDAATVYRHGELDPDKANNKVNRNDPADPHMELAPPPNQLGEVYKPSGLDIPLRYGRNYAFRVRLRDLSGGGPAPGASPVWDIPSAEHTTRFKRYVAPQQPRLDDAPVNTDTPQDPDSLTLRRPRLGYPAVVYTGAYADPVARLIADSNDEDNHEAFGIPDPDVDRIEITVEAETLKLDNLASVSGRENYVVLYRTTRPFAPVADDDDYAAPLSIPLVYRDVRVLHTGDELDLAGDLKVVGGNIDDIEEIVLPTARRIRLTLRALCADKPDNSKYYGRLSKDDPEADSRFGHILEVSLYRPSSDETGLFVEDPPVDRLRAMMLRASPPPAPDGRRETLLFGRKLADAPDIAKRLAAELGLEANGLTLVAPKGERVQFGCSSRIRHTLSPDNSSVTFASEGDLINHWLSCVQLTVDRDWMWDGLADLSFSFKRTVRFSQEAKPVEQDKAIGDIEVRRTASFEMLHEPKRTYTRLVFIDAVEPKKEPKDGQAQPDFPDTIEVEYSVSTTFKDGHAATRDGPEDLIIALPISTPPAQVPKIASAGLALSPYRRNEKYSETAPRRRLLWVEFAEPVADPDDTYFARVLAYAPDQLISNNHPDLLVAPEEPPLPIDPELTRVIVPDESNDLAGLGAMQPMTKAIDSEVHYLLPLPPGLDANADEMFGFFTYEFRLGHHRRGEDMVWTTAQGRFGRRLKATGIQHPAPALTCTVNRDEDKLWVVAPFAAAVFDGRNVTPDPPRTQLWCLLYAQVRQADNLDTRNILLDDKQLDARVQVNPDPPVNPARFYDDAQLKVLKEVAVKNARFELSLAKLAGALALVPPETGNREVRRYGTAIWSNDEVAQWLDMFGLPADSPLSVLVVETLPQITRLSEHVSLDELAKRPVEYNTVQMQALTIDRRTETVARHDSPRQTASPVSDELGEHRILRTSPLTEVPFVCCPN